MASSVIGSLRVALGIDSAEFSRGADRAEKRTRKLGNSIEKTLGGSIDRATGALKGFIGAYLGLEGAKKFLEYADAAKSMDAQLRLATASFGTLGKAQDDVNRIASVTRSGLLETTSLYGNFVRASAALGKTQDEAARATETFAKALMIGGAGTAEAASATLQFGQALASGVLRGDEFNSIAEASPRILTLLADSLGVNSGALRQMAADGKLTSEVLYRAFTDRRFTDGIDAEFKTLPVTFKQAMTLIESAAITTIGAFDTGGQFSTDIANFVSGGAEGLASLAKSAHATGVDIRSIFEGLDDVFEPLNQNGLATFANLTSAGTTFTQRLRSEISALIGKTDELNNYLRFGAAGGPVRQEAERRGLTVNNKGVFDNGARLSAATARANAAARRLEVQGFVVPRNADGSINEAGIKRKPASKAPAPVTTGTTDKEDKKGAAAAKKAEREEERAAEKARRDLIAFNRDLARSREEELSSQLDLTVDQTERANLRRQLLESDHRAVVDAINANDDYSKTQKDELIASAGIVAANKRRLAAIEDQEEASRRAVERAEAEGRDALDILDAQAGLARTAKERREIELQILDVQFRLLKQAKQTEIDNAVARGDQPAADLARGQLATIGTVEGMARSRVVRSTQGPLARYFDSIPKTADEMNEALEGIQANGLADLIDGLATAKGSFKDLASVVDNVANDIISSLIRIGLQKGAAALFGGLFGGGSATGYANPFASSGSFPTLPGVDLGFLAGARAKGGSVIGGRNYLVGEMGPEIFTAPHSGNIIANDDISSGGGLIVNMGGVHVTGGVDLATRTEVYRLAAATKDATVAAIGEANRRRG